MDATLQLDDPVQIAAATHPVRAAILASMRGPTSAAEAGRRVGQSRQNAAYHVKELAKVGLLRPAGTRQNGTFVEQLYEPVASTILISSRATWGPDPARADALADQLSLGELVAAGERLQADAALLLDRAAFDGAEIASASVAADVGFADAANREAFLREYVTLVADLASRHGAAHGERYRVLFAAYPDPEPTHEP